MRLEPGDQRKCPKVESWYYKPRLRRQVKLRKAMNGNCHQGNTQSETAKVQSSTIAQCRQDRLMTQVEETQVTEIKLSTIAESREGKLMNQVAEAHQGQTSLESGSTILQHS